MKYPTARVNVFPGARSLAEVAALVSESINVTLELDPDYPYNESTSYRGTALGCHIELVGIPDDMEWMEERYRPTYFAFLVRSNLAEKQPVDLPQFVSLSDYFAEFLTSQTGLRCEAIPLPSQTDH